MVTRASATRRRAYREMLVAGVLWGTIGPAVVIVADHTSLSPLQTAFWRLIIGALPLGALAVLRAHVKPTRTLLLFGLAVGATMAISQLAYFAAVANSGIAIPTLIANGLGPIFTAAGQTFIFRERPDGRTLAGDGGGARRPRAARPRRPGQRDGDRHRALDRLRGRAYAASTLAAGPASRRLDTTTLNAASVAGGALAMLPFILVTGGPGVAGSAVGWLAIGWLGLVVSGLAYWLYYSAARELPSTHLTIIALLDPLVSAVIAVAFFDETLTLGVIVGGALMLGAVAALRAPPDQEPHPPPT